MSSLSYSFHLVLSRPLRWSTLPLTVGTTLPNWQAKHDVPGRIPQWDRFIRKRWMVLLGRNLALERSAMGSGEQPEFSLVAEEVIIRHCLWPLVSQKEIENLLDASGGLVTMRLTGRAIANSKAAAITVQVLKEDVIRISEHPARRLSPGDLPIRAVFPKGEVIIDQLNHLEDAAGVIASDPPTVRHDLLRRWVILAS